MLKQTKAAWRECLSTVPSTRKNTMVSEAPGPTPLYRDSGKSVDDRVSDLLSCMTVAEKAGQLFQDKIIMGPGGTLTGPSPEFRVNDTEEVLRHKLMTHFNLLGPIADAKVAAEWYNSLQRYALEHTRLGIPVTLSTDPRHHFSENVGTGFRAGMMSLWPETLGFAALRDVHLVEKFADIARREYLAVGLRLALHPQADLSTEYRWARIAQTFGEDAKLAGDLVQAYIRGFQGPKLGKESVATMTKHFPGGGPQMNGEDPHFAYGREQVYPGKNSDYHLIPFQKAIEVGTSQIMPYYGMPVGTEYEEVGFAFNKGIITGLLKNTMGFGGIVCSDWGLITDTQILGQDMPARAWGCEALSEEERILKILEAGCDQFGGESRPELIVKLVKEGLLPESRLDESVRKLLREKFTLGLFDNPFVDADAAATVVGNAEFVKEGEVAQRKSYTLLTNKNSALPLGEADAKTKNIYIEGVNPSVVEARGLKVTSSLSEADIAFLRLRCPYEPRPGGFEAYFHAGSLEFPAEEKVRQSKIYQKVPISIVDVYLDRPAVIPEVAAQACALLVNFGSSDDAFLDIVFGADGIGPQGKLPFDLPSSMEAVSKSREDVPFDTEAPSFRFGHGLRYKN
jgi:beta-glucosidase